MTDQHIDIPDSKQREFFGGPFGVNRRIEKRKKLPVDSDTVYEAFWLYFRWASSIEDEEMRERALREGEFALRDMQTKGHTEVRVGTPDYMHYDGLPTRGNRVDTIEMRRKVFSRITGLVVELDKGGMSCITHATAE
ncbi:hypothetical protein EYC59_01825 [Candidatus Saccharibacteria bacterium]|nr:MAG: hypothetical protein EYC59_01825 [Candidatus Saccharibacteria bacterium]